MFKTYDITPGVCVHVLKDTRFHRTHVSLFMSGVLNRDTASETALLPPVLVRGTARLPKAFLLEREMATLYGARMGAGIGKSGDRQVFRVALNLPDEKYAGGEVLGQGLSFLSEVLTDPYLPGGAFDPDYVQQEKMQLIGRIRALINNKVRYAVQKGIQEIFKGEPAAISEEGTEEQVSEITPESLLERYRAVISSYPVDLYVVGDVDPDRTADLVKERLDLPESGRLASKPSIVAKGTGELGKFFATEPMEQGWLIIGIKSGISMCMDSRWTLTMLNGVLGGYPHSKLFANVREKASLAYGAGSFLDPTKGAIIAYAGIDPKNYRDASNLMFAQLSDIAKGNVTDEELSATREAMVTEIRLQLDTPGYLIHTHFTARSEGCYEDVPGSIEAINKVNKDDIISMAGEVRPDTLFFLSSMKGEE